MRSYKTFNFVYLVYAIKRTSEQFSPFAFRFVENVLPIPILRCSSFFKVKSLFIRITPFHEITSKNYLTVSTHGVLFHSPGEITFTSLDEWEKEYNYFCQLSKVHPFGLILEGNRHAANHCFFLFVADTHVQTVSHVESVLYMEKDRELEEVQGR